MDTEGLFNTTQEFIKIDHETKQLLSIAGVHTPPVSEEIIKKLLPTPVTIDIIGVPAVLEQKTTILYKPLYLLVSNQRASHLSSGVSTRVEGVDENHF